MEKLTIYYGRVESFWVVRLPSTPWTDGSQLLVLALFSPCANTGGRDATKEVVTYTTLHASKFVAVNTIEAVVGRIRLAVDKEEWAIADRSAGEEGITCQVLEDVVDEMLDT